MEPELLLFTEQLPSDNPYNVSFINIILFNTYNNICKNKISHFTTLQLRKLKPRKFIKLPINFYLIIFREGKGREKRRETSMCGCL